MNWKLGENVESDNLSGIRPVLLEVVHRYSILISEEKMCSSERTGSLQAPKQRITPSSSFVLEQRVLNNSLMHFAILAALNRYKKSTISFFLE